jgi:hypothetical protein
MAWIVEFDGKRIAQIVDAEFDDMFWESWRVIPEPDDSAAAALAGNMKLWLSQKLTFRYCHLPSFIGEHVIIGECSRVGSGRIATRGLCPPMHSLWERILLRVLPRLKETHDR